MAKDVAHIKDGVLKALDQLRPYLAKDGGDMELVNVTEDGVVQVKLKGNCATCSMSDMTMKIGLEEAVKKAVPDVVRVEAINDKAEV